VFEVVFMLTCPFPFPEVGEIVAQLPLMSADHEPLQVISKDAPVTDF
jgi:hypothetical protein